MIAPATIDLHLCLLWRHCGRSWTALARRLARAPGAAAKLAALQSLRARTAGRQAPLPGFRAHPSARGLEDALGWLVAPATPLPPVMPADELLAGLPTAVLVRRLRTLAPMPRREMQELLRRGPAVVAALVGVVGDGERCAPGVLWAVVLLGELRDPSAIPALDRLLGGRFDGVGIAAAEALGKLGPEAVRVLIAHAWHGTRAQRVLAYGALGTIDSEDAHRCLLAALERDPTLADVVAAALAGQRRPDAIPALHAGVEHAPPRMRFALERTIVALSRGAATPDPPDDWRLRYRPLPRLGWQPPPTALALAAALHGPRRLPRHRTTVRPLADILADPRLGGDSRTCPRCTGVIWRPSGMPLCRHTAGAVLALQQSILRRWLDAGITDIWAALDHCDAVDAHAGGAVPAGRAPTDASGTRDVIAVARATLYWLVELQRNEVHMDLRMGLEQLALLAEDIARAYRGAAASSFAAAIPPSQPPPSFS